jgi:hypothetical protein
MMDCSLSDDSNAAPPMMIAASKTERKEDRFGSFR